MTFNPYPIVPFYTGLEKDKEPFLLDDDAFPELTDAYLYRGKIHKRLGASKLGQIGTEQNASWIKIIGPLDITYSNTLPVVPIVPGSVRITLNALLFLDDGSGNLSAGAGTSGDIDYFTGVFKINFPAPGFLSGITVIWQSANRLPVMGLITQETFNINAENLIAFDTTKANLFDTNLQTFVDISFNIKT